MRLTGLAGTIVGLTIGCTAGLLPILALPTDPEDEIEPPKNADGSSVMKNKEKIQSIPIKKEEPRKLDETSQKLCWGNN